MAQNHHEIIEISRISKIDNSLEVNFAMKTLKMHEKFTFLYIMNLEATQICKKKVSGQRWF